MGNTQQTGSTMTYKVNITVTNETTAPGSSGEHGNGAPMHSPVATHNNMTVQPCVEITKYDGEEEEENNHNQRRDRLSYVGNERHSEAEDDNDNSGWCQDAHAAMAPNSWEDDANNLSLHLEASPEELIIHEETRDTNKYTPQLHQNKQRTPWSEKDETTLKQYLVQYPTNTNKSIAGLLTTAQALERGSVTPQHVKDKIRSMYSSGKMLTPTSPQQRTGASSMKSRKQVAQVVRQVNETWVQQQDRDTAMVPYGSTKSKTTVPNRKRTVDPHQVSKGKRRQGSNMEHF